MIASFDIGEKNFAYSIGKMMDDKNVRIIKVVYENVLERKNQTVIDSCKKISRLLESDKDILSCDTYLIEQQMKANSRSTRVSQHVWTFLFTRFPDKQPPIFVPSSLKTRHFLGKNELKNKERKKWAVEKVLSEDVRVHLDEDVLRKIKELEKKDDVCDTILQMLAHVART